MTTTHDNPIDTDAIRADLSRDFTPPVPVKALLDEIDRLRQLVEDAPDELDRFVIVQHPTTFGGDDCATGYSVVDRTLAQPDFTIGAVVLRGDYLECRAAAHVANNDPDGWDNAFRGDDTF